MAIRGSGAHLDDVRIALTGTNFSTSVLGIQSYWLTPPRTYGLEITYEL
jgi:hypothetical protein